MRRFPGVVLKQGYCGYTDFANNVTGNSIDLLTKYLDYTFCDAVEALSGTTPHGSTIYSCSEDMPKSLCLPVASKPPYSRVIAYLTRSRGISLRTVQRLIASELLYQDAEHGNAVFVNRDRDYCEIRGTLTYGKPFHGCLRSSPNCFWSFGRPTGDAHTAYICEAAIDAISLFEILSSRGSVNAIFCSIGGVANQRAIQTIADRYNAVLAVDNDEAGLKCRERNPGLNCMISIRKDWNEDLLAMKAARGP